ncbi:hypothetical protein DFH09DRAFT_1323160 [Mycena vulgaris]|nr:hypothetical protein DFH09DRAFT_1323160 [Mycena vulgaris]
MHVMFHIPELTDQVIDHLHADRASLDNCALVSRSWLPASQYHLFFAVDIKHDKTCRRLCDIIIESPHIGSYIRYIYIYFDARLPSFFSLLDLRVPDPRRLSIVNCPHTKELVLIQHLLSDPLLTDVRFFSGTSVSRAQLDYICRIRTSNLNNLLLYSASDTPAPEDRDWVPSATPLDVSALTISGDATLVTATLTDPSGPINLRAIDALTFDSADTPCLQRMLSICSDIVILEILVPSTALVSHLHIDERTLPSVTNLRLYDIDATTLPSVLHLLSQLGPSAALQSLRLGARISDDNDSDTPHPSPFSPTPATRALWTDIDAALSALRALVSVSFDEPSAGETQTFSPDTCLPILERRKILNAPRRARSGRIHTQ